MKAQNSFRNNRKSDSSPDENFFKNSLNKPPFALEAERSVLGAMLIDESAVSKALEILKPEYFYDKKHAIVFSSMISLYEASEPIDIVSLYEELKKEDKTNVVSAEFIGRIVEDISSAVNVEYHSRYIVDKWILRQLIKSSFEIASSAYDQRDDVFNLLDNAESVMFQIREESLKESYKTLDMAVREGLEYIEAIHQKDLSSFAVKTGFYSLDDMLGGLQKSDLIILAARPSMGKTALALAIARNAAIEENVPIAIFSLEMSYLQLAMRLISSEARINAHDIRTGKFKSEDGPKISRTVHKLAKAPVYIDDTPALGILELRAKARRLKSERHIGLIIIDYLQLMSANSVTEGREREISMISRSLKALAKELNVPVIALSQLNRSVEQSSDKRPMLSHLRESGSIEQDADVVMFLYRPEVYGIETSNNGESTEGLAELIIGKQRNGPIGTVELQFIKNYARFESKAIFTNQLAESITPLESPEEDFPI